VPGAAIRAGHTLRVQRAGDGERARTPDIVTKDPPHDDRAGLIHLPQPPHRLAIGPELPDRPIAIGHPPGTKPLPGAPLQTAMGLLGKVLEVQRPHGALEADVELGNLPLGQGDDLDPGEHRQLVKGCDMLEVAGEPVQALGQHNVGLAIADRREQRLIAGPQRGRPGDRRIRMGAGDGPSLPLGAGGADAQLVLDRGLALVVGGIACIDEAAPREAHGSVLRPITITLAAVT